MLIIRIARRHGTNGGFGLDLHETLIIIDIKDGLGAIINFPNYNGRNFNWRAVELIDLELAAFKITNAEANFLFRIKGIVETQARGADCTDIFSE